MVIDYYYFVPYTIEIYKCDQNINIIKCSTVHAVSIGMFNVFNKTFQCSSDLGLNSVSVTPAMSTNMLSVPSEVC